MMCICLSHIINHDSFDQGFRHMRGDRVLQFHGEEKRRDGMIGPEEGGTSPPWEIQFGQGADKWQRISAIDTISLSPSEAAVTAMVFCLHDPDSDVRFAAVEGLGKIGGPGSEEALVDACEDPNYYVRSAAAEALQHLRAVHRSLYTS